MESFEESIARIINNARSEKELTNKIIDATAMTIMSCLKKAEAFEGQRMALWDIYPMIYVISDYAVLSAGKENRKEVASYVIDSMKATLPEDELDVAPLVFDERVTFYASIISGRVEPRADCLPGVPSDQIEDPLFKVVIAWGDIIIGGEDYVEDYQNAAITACDLFQVKELFTEVIKYTGDCLITLFKGIYDYS